MKKKIAVLFGGVSSEHEVSRRSAVRIMDSMPQEYDVVRLGITKAGKWLLCPSHVSTADIASGAWEQDPGCQPAFIVPDTAVHGLMRFDGASWVTERIDAVFPALHGKYGEDGTVQGLLEMAGIPYVGCGVLASAACMDKVVANTLFDNAGVPQAKWDWMTTAQLGDWDAIEARVSAKLGYPIFVKPANAGSSVGVSKANNAAELRAAVELAADHDTRILFEETIVGHEVECAVLGNPVNGEGDLIASTPGEILAGDVFYTYDDKYTNGVSQTVIPAHVPAAQLAEVQRLAAKAYTALGCSGLARCDFFVQADGKVLINEINTLPGFTSISMYPMLMDHEGIDNTQLVRRLVKLAEDAAAARTDAIKRSLGQ